MDLNGDGNLDILSGSYSRASADMAGLFQVLYGQSNGKFRKVAVLNGTDEKPLIIPTKDQEHITEAICTRPFAIDFDGDGKLDLVVGTFAGTFYVFTGEGKGKFKPAPAQIMVGDKPLRIEGYHSDPFVIDWDGDGDLDILSGSSNGGVQWAENTAGKAKPPRFEGFKPLIKAPAEQEYGYRDEKLTGPTSSTRIWVADVNGDGKLDVLVGDSVNLISPLKGDSEAEFAKRYAEWKEKLRVANEAAEAVKDNPEKQREVWDKVNEVYRQTGNYMNEERTGFVWLYKQK